MEKAQFKVMSDVEENHFWYKGMRLITKSILSRYFKSKENYILDAGCGTGGNFNLLNQFGTVVGIDISDIAIKLAKKKGITNIKKASIDNIPYSSNSFDLITCFDVLGHKLVHEKNAYHELYRVLKPGGIMILRSAAYKWLYSYHDVLVQNERRYSKKELFLILKKYKFTPLKITYANFFLFPLIVLKRFINKILKKNSHESDSKYINSFLNIIYLIPLLIESFLVKYINLPFGVSIIVVAKKHEKTRNKKLYFIICHIFCIYIF